MYLWDFFVIAKSGNEGGYAEYPSCLLDPPVPGQPIVGIPEDNFRELQGAIAKVLQSEESLRAFPVIIILFYECLVNFYFYSKRVIEVPHLFDSVISMHPKEML